MDKHIVIIGAGASGIAAATKLLANGFANVSVLEAGSKIGGRVNTIPFGNGFIDLGAQWCHGQQNNVVYELAKNLGVLEHFDPEMDADNINFVQSNGHALSREINKKLMVLMSVLEVKEQGEGPSEGSYADIVKSKYECALELDEYRELVGTSVASQFLHTLHHIHRLTNGSDTWFDTSCRNSIDREECDGDKLIDWKGRGYRTIFDVLMNKLPNLPVNEEPIEPNILLNKQVSLVRWSPQISTKTIIECTDGSVIKADHVICTVSVGVLMTHHESLFTPELPLIKRNAIQSLKLGTVNKIYIELKEPFWSPTWTGFTVLWTDVDLAYLRANPDESWIECLGSFATVRYHPNVLCGWTAGPLSREMEKHSDEDVKRVVAKWLKRMVSDKTVSDIVSISRSRWSSEPNFLGSYSYQSVRGDELRSLRTDLAAPVLNSSGLPVLQFAGEATESHHFATVNGAIETGWREANRLIEFYNSEKNTNNYTESVSNDETYQTLYDVIILGAGLAGLGAALQLTKSNLSFMLLEGQTKAGGRVNTMHLISSNTNTSNQQQQHDDAHIEFTNNIKHITEEGNSVPTSPTFIDSGAQWLHGKCNYLHDVAERHHLLSDEQSEEGLGAFIRDDGVVLDEYLVKKTDFLVGEILTECEKYAHEQSTNDDWCNQQVASVKQTTTSYPKSVNSYLLERFQTYLAGIKDADQRLQAEQLLDWHIRFQVIDNSCLSLDDVSAKSWGMYSYNGESCQAHYNFRRGFSSAVEALVEEIGTHQFRFNMDIREVAVNTDDDAGIISVRCADGTVFRAKHVVCTFSIGSLKHGLDMQMFRPELPVKMSRTIRAMGFETINKLFLQFDEAWWGDWDGIQLVFKNKHYEHQNWTRHISGFDVMRPGPSNTLLAWVGGHGALEMEALSDQVIVQDCVDLLIQFTGMKVPKPIKYFCTRWHTNPFVRGAYSYISTSCDQSGTSNRCLAEPITLLDFRKSLRLSSTIYQPNSTSNSAINNTYAMTSSLSSPSSPTISSNRTQTNKSSRTQSTTQSSTFRNNCDDATSISERRPLVLFAGEAVHDQYFSTAHGAFLSGMEQSAKIVDFYTHASVNID